MDNNENKVTVEAVLEKTTSGCVFFDKNNEEVKILVQAVIDGTVTKEKLDAKLDEYCTRIRMTEADWDFVVYNLYPLCKEKKVEKKTIPDLELYAIVNTNISYHDDEFRAQWLVKITVSGEHALLQGEEMTTFLNKLVNLNRIGTAKEKRVHKWFSKVGVMEYLNELREKFGKCLFAYANAMAEVDAALYSLDRTTKPYCETPKGREQIEKVIPDTTQARAKKEADDAHKKLGLVIAGGVLFVIGCMIGAAINRH